VITFSRDVVGQMSVGLFLVGVAAFAVSLLDAGFGPIAQVCVGLGVLAAAALWWLHRGEAHPSISASANSDDAKSMRTRIRFLVLILGGVALAFALWFTHNPFVSHALMALWVLGAYLTFWRCPQCKRHVLPTGWWSNSSDGKCPRCGFGLTPPSSAP
jgi:uncharacterized membrane protein YbaN (DUF454 family)